MALSDVLTILDCIYACDHWMDLLLLLDLRASLDVYFQPCTVFVCFFLYLITHKTLVYQPP